MVWIDDLKFMFAAPSRFRSDRLWFGENPKQEGADLLDGPATMTQPPFGYRSQLTKGPMIFYDLKQRIIAETLFPLFGEGDSASAPAARFSPDGAAWIGQRQMTHKGSGPLFRRHIGQFRQKPTPIRRIVRPRTGISGRVHPRPTSQSIHHQAAIVGQNPMARLPGVPGRLAPGIFGKRLPIFFYRMDAGNIGQSNNLYSRQLQQPSQFLPLFPIKRSNQQHPSCLHRESSSRQPSLIILASLEPIGYSEVFVRRIGPLGTDTNRHLDSPFARKMLGGLFR
jgi:hypothetical protein